MSLIKKAVLNYFDPVNYIATVHLIGSDKAYLEGVSVAKNISASEMIAGRNLLVVLLDGHNTKDAVVVAVY
jgi:hypothetical protein